MPTPREVRAHLAGLAGLTAPPREHRPRPVHHLLAEVADACRALHTATESWRTFEPTPGAVHDAELTAEGLRRALAELRQVRKGGPRDGDS